MQNLTTGAFYSGLSGLQLPVPRYLFPPPFENASRLSFYSSLFNSIEINSSFYKIPRSATVAKWADSVPDDFKFTFKLSKGVTHCKDLEFNREDVLMFFRSINAVAEKKGCLLIQFPPSLASGHLPQLKKLLIAITEIDILRAWKIAVEFRNGSWYHERVYEILDFYGAAMVMHDISKSATPPIVHSSDFLYLRFHGPAGNYRGSYADDFLSEYATYINEWREEGKKVFVYFNNTMGDAFKNLKTLDRLV